MTDVTDTEPGEAMPVRIWALAEPDNDGRGYLLCTADPNFSTRRTAFVRADLAEELAAALEAMVAEKADYMRRNHLGKPEQQQSIRDARSALSAYRSAVK